jgi:hypothetical protein
MNEYQVATLVGVFVQFYQVPPGAAPVPADPTTVQLFIEDQTGNVTQIPTSQIARTGVGAYTSNLLPTEAGLWKYKWQGTGTVIVTSKDGAFFVKASDMVAPP